MVGKKVKIRGEIWEVMEEIPSEFGCFCKGLTGIVTGQTYFFSPALDKFEVVENYEPGEQFIIDVPNCPLPNTPKTYLSKYYNCYTQKHS